MTLTAEQQREWRRVYNEWHEYWESRIEPDPEYMPASVNVPSQYAEGWLAVSATAEAEDDLERRLSEAGLAPGE